MPYVKIVLLFCSIAVFLAGCGNLIFHLSARFAGGATVAATQTGWAVLLFGWWTTSFLVALYLAIVLRIFPFSIAR
jgi:hypothetical protein